ncbi:glycosyltransferase [Gryllotalpicola koreensis]|uniref:Glycosyltransferase n=1 Tax=Gryllotalpicola koreensis TaxID=993086 RepID=A0ABP8ADL1_9MICO
MVHFGFLSSYPPTRCGLATFTESLISALVSAGGADARIVRVFDASPLQPMTMLGAHAAIAADLIGGDRVSMAATIGALNSCEIAIIQHEYGIYGGPDGDEVVEVLQGLTVASIVVLHTVLVDPTAHQREILRDVCQLASEVVVMTEIARDLLIAEYDVEAIKVNIIPHGVPEWAETTASRPHTTRRVLTWGLISPGKGIEWGIRAMAQLGDLGRSIEYVAAGQTHPKVLAHSGESYREMLLDLAAELDVESVVTIDGRYRDRAELAELVRSADVVLLPYESRDQATSGVLAEAVAAGIPVVATEFPHAVELLSGGAGLIVAHEDPAAIAAALRRVLMGSGTANAMRSAARRDSANTSWPVVASKYRLLSERLIARAAA